MSNPHPTPTRLALLRDVAAGWVWFDYDSGDSILEPDRDGPIQTKVTTRMDEFDRAGWVVIPPMRSVYQLTDEGRAVLDQHDTKER